MDATKVGNDLMEHGYPTFHVCARCVTFFGDDGLKFLGKVGCYMPNTDEETDALYKEWSVKGADGTITEYRRCLRCFINNQECCALPERFRSDLEEVEGHLRNLRRGYTVRALNEAEKAKKAAGEVVTTNRVTLDAAEAELKQFKLAKVCKAISKIVNRELVPHSEHLHLHNGVTEKDDDPQSGIRPGGRKRDSTTIAAKREAKKRNFEAAVASEVDKSGFNDGTPRKKKQLARATLDPAVEARRKHDELDTRIDALKLQQAAATGKKKSGLTREIKKLTSERNQLAAQFDLD